MAFVNKSWDGSASRWDNPDAYAKACLIDLNPAGQPKTKSLCKLPVQEPNGDYNVNAIHAAAAALAGGRGGVQAPPAAKKGAAKRLKNLYAQMKESLPISLQSMAS